MAEALLALLALLGELCDPSELRDTIRLPQFCMGPFGSLLLGPRFTNVPLFIWDPLFVILFISVPLLIDWLNGFTAAIPIDGSSRQKNPFPAGIAPSVADSSASPDFRGNDSGVSSPGSRESR